MRLTMLRRNLRKKCHKQGEASSENPEAAEHAHRSPQLTHLPWRLAIGVRVLTIPTKKGEHHQASCLVRAGLASFRRQPRHRIYGSGIPGVATIPAIRKISKYSASVIAEMSNRTFLSIFTFFSAVFALSSANVTCRGSLSNARKSATRFFPLWSCGSG